MKKSGLFSHSMIVHHGYDARVLLGYCTPSLVILVVSTEGAIIPIHVLIRDTYLTPFILLQDFPLCNLVEITSVTHIFTYTKHFKGLLPK